MLIFILYVLNHSVVPSSLGPHGLQPTRLLGPWDFRGKNTEVVCHFLFQGIFLTQGSNPGLLHFLHWQVYSLPLSHLKRPCSYVNVNTYACVTKQIDR